VIFIVLICLHSQVQDWDDGSSSINDGLMLVW
jgi:hypothetical protein